MRSPTIRYDVELSIGAEGRLIWIIRECWTLLAIRRKNVWAIGQFSRPGSSIPPTSRAPSAKSVRRCAAMQGRISSFVRGVRMALCCGERRTGVRFIAKARTIWVYNQRPQRWRAPGKAEQRLATTVVELREAQRCSRIT